MEESQNIDVNSGVQANVGMDFQRNCSLYLFLEKYHKIKHRKYFIILEHYDDIVFGFVDKNNFVNEVETYQAKKSANSWTTNNLFEIIEKIINNGIKILEDDILKSNDYFQKQYFATNNTIKLTYKDSQTKKDVHLYVNETNDSVPFESLGHELKQSLIEGNTHIKFDSIQQLHFKNLQFNYLDFGRNSKAQLELLIGKFQSVFADTIIDHKAARDTFLYHLKTIESTYNQGNKAKLSDYNKRLESDKVNEILSVLTTKKLALEFCRKKAEVICKKLKISIFDSNYFEFNFENSLDKFKDLTQGEHQKIYHFVEDNKILLNNYYDDTECILAFFEKFEKEYNTILGSVQLKASISAAYFLIKEQS